jgi:membrane protease YdiL (CAAX protease family)
MAALGYIAGASNPLLYPLAGTRLSIPTILVMASSSLGIGYSEELFFRFFAVTTLEKAEFSSAVAIFLSAVLFSASHGSQGVFGIIGTGLLAILFSFFRARGKGLHALALGHALYDFVVLLAVV